MRLALFTANRKSTDPRSLQARGDFVPAARPKPAADPLEQMLRAGRLGLIVHHNEAWISHPHLQTFLGQAVRAIDERFALVPAGTASIPLTICDQPGQPEVECEVGPFLLARCAVTNAEYQCFVDDDGYANLEFWPEEIWPLLIGFKDQTAEPGPRYWQNGRHDRRLADHPVVGISFCEAAAYALWAGYRLPTEAEWQMAAGWRLRSVVSAHRRYPWGDSLDRQRCNIWASGHGGTLPVNDCAGGAAPNGALQLTGNVWEWTSSDFLCADRDGRPVVGDTLMKSVRGGAFDTYFPAQATSTFRTGQSCVARCHNVGFRCAMDLIQRGPCDS